MGNLLEPPGGPTGLPGGLQDFGQDRRGPASLAQDTSKIGVLHESGKHFTRNAQMEFMAAPSDFGAGAPELEAAIRKLAFCTRVAHISEGKEF